MSLIEGFRVQNYRSLRDITLGRLPGVNDIEKLTPLTVVIGKNGAGKSALFDAFGFLADCLTAGVEAACDREQRGGFERMRSMGVDEPIRFSVYYREAPNQRPITYNLAIDLDRSGRPFVESEELRQRRQGQRDGQRFPFLRLSQGKGLVWAGETAVEVEGEESNERLPVELTDTRQLGIGTLGTLRDHPRITRFRDFLKGWYLSYFTPDAARSLPVAGPQRHLNVHGDNLGNVVQFMQREHKDRFAATLRRIAERIPGVKSIDTQVTQDKRVLLRFNDSGFQDPFFAQQMSDGTLKVFAYLLLLEDPDPPPFICIEFLSELRDLATACGAVDMTLFRLAIEEMEAWYLGDREALQKAYPKVRARALEGYVQDSVRGTWELLADAIHAGGSKAVRKAGWPLPGQLKHEWADRIGPLLDPDRNQSPSFGKLRDGLRRLIQQHGIATLPSPSPA